MKIVKHWLNKKIISHSHHRYKCLVYFFPHWKKHPIMEMSYGYKEEEYNFFRFINERIRPIKYMFPRSYISSSKRKIELALFDMIFYLIDFL